MTANHSKTDCPCCKGTGKQPLPRLTNTEICGLCDGTGIDLCEVHWRASVDNHKSLSIQERNFRKRIGIEPNKEMFKRVYQALKMIPPMQTELKF